MADVVSHNEILVAVQALDRKIGAEEIETATGKIVATGVFARLHAIEAKDQRGELNRLRWKNRLLGVTAAASICAGVVMYFAGDRVSGIQDTVRHPPSVQVKK